MIRLKCALVCAAIGATLAATPDAKAEPMTHDGFYLSLEAGLGYLSTSAESEGQEFTASGMTMSTGLLLGGTVGPVAIGGGFTYDNAFSPTAEQNGQEVLDDVDVSLHLIGIGAFADYYLDPSGGLHFLGFLGWGGLDATVDGNSGGSDPTGLLITLGGGYDFWMADEWSIGPLARFTYAPLSYESSGFKQDWPTWQFSVVADIKYH